MTGKRYYGLVNSVLKGSVSLLTENKWPPEKCNVKCNEGNSGKQEMNGMLNSP